MSGFILNCCAPFKALRRFKVQEFKETLAVQAVPAVQPLRSPRGSFRSNCSNRSTVALRSKRFGNFENVERFKQQQGGE
jgi:hypothetical protein